MFKYRAGGFSSSVCLPSRITEITLLACGTGRHMTSYRPSFTFLLQICGNNCYVLRFTVITVSVLTVCVKTTVTAFRNSANNAPFQTRYPTRCQK